LTIDVLHRRVWLWDGAEPAAPCWHLLVRRELGARVDLKYSLSNAAADIPVLRLAQMQGQRLWVERTFQDGKSQAGLDHYQARSWRAWHHHMALLWSGWRCCSCWRSASPPLPPGLDRNSAQYHAPSTADATVTHCHERRH
jgi:hypothetical protein